MDETQRNILFSENGEKKRNMKEKMLFWGIPEYGNLGRTKGHMGRGI